MTYTYAGGYSETVITTGGALAKGITVNVYISGGTTPATLYTDHTKGSTASNPVTTDSTTAELSFFADPGLYDLVGSGISLLRVSVPPDPAEYVQASAVSAKGDLLAATGNAALARVGVGTNNQALVAASGQSTGVQWQAVVNSVAGRTGAVVLTSADTVANIQSKTSAYTAVSGDTVLADATSGAFAVTLPTATAGAKVTVKKIDSSGNAVTLTGTVDGASNPTLSNQWEAAELVGNGSTWNRLVRPALATVADYPATSDARYQVSSGKNGASGYQGLDSAKRIVAQASAITSAAAGANAGTSPPTPVSTGCTDQAGTITFGSGSGSPAAGAQVVVTFSGAWTTAPSAVVITPNNDATQQLGLWAAKPSTTAFTLSTHSAPGTSQANTVYSFSYVVIG